MIGRTFALAAALLAAPAMSTPGDLRSVAAMQNHNRVLLVFAPALDDARLQAQRGEVGRAALAMSERDVILVQVAGEQVIGAHDAADKLRRKYRVNPALYRTLLIGKDGKVAMAIVGPISAAHLEERIDAMPMRQNELRRAREGKAVRAN